MHPLPILFGEPAATVMRLGLSSQLLAYTFGMLDDSPCTVRPHSPAKGAGELSCPPHPVALAATSIRSSLPWLNGSLYATVLKAFNTAGLLLAEGSFTGFISKVLLSKTFIFVVMYLELFWIYILNIRYLTNFNKI